MDVAVLWLLLSSGLTDTVAAYDHSEPPSLHDLHRFPDNHVAGEQLCRITRYRLLLTQLEQVHGYGDGRYCRWRTELDLYEKYWCLLQAASSDPFGIGPYWKRTRLQDLRNLIGEENYLSGWCPPLLPEKVEPLWKPITPVAPKAQDRNNHG